MRQLHLRQPVADAAMDAEAERQMLPRPRAVDDEVVRVVRSRPRRDCPRRTTSPPCRPALMRLPPSSTSSSAVRRMWVTGVTADDLRHQAGDQPGIVAQLAVFAGEPVQRQHAAGNRIPRRVVAADQQQDQVAEELAGATAGRASPRRAPAWRSGRAAAADLRARARATVKYSSIFCSTASRFGSESISVPARVFTVATFGPVGQRAPVLKRKIEQRRQHLRGQLDRYAIHPVERLAPRQCVQDASSPLADRARELLQVHRARRSAPPPCVARRASAGPSR